MKLVLDETDLRKYHLMTPGPTAVPPQVALTMAQPVYHFQSPTFQKILLEVRAGMQRLFQTTGDVVILVSSGTGAMEAAVANLHSAGDRVVAISIGTFSDRWAQIARAYGLEVVTLTRAPGQGATAEELDEVLTSQPGVTSVLVPHSETSTGVLLDVPGLTKVAHAHGALILVDAISSLGAAELRMDEWEVDVAVGASQKGVMLPPGLGFVAIREAIWDRVAAARLPRFYFDLLAEREVQRRGVIRVTLATSLIVGLRASLDMIFTEGLEQVLRRHDRIARATRAGVAELGLELFTKGTPSPAVTAIEAPPGIDANAIVRAYSELYNVAIAGGWGDLSGRLFRLGHLGYIGDTDVLVTIGALEMILSTLGHPVDLGTGIRAAQKVLLGS